MIWYERICFDLMPFDRYDMDIDMILWYYDMIFDSRWYDMIMIRYDMIWFDMVSNDLVLNNDCGPL